MRWILAAVLVLGMTACGGSSTSYVVPPLMLVLDQEFVPGTSDSLVGGDASVDWGQTFTVGVTGDLYTLDLLLEEQGLTEVVRIDLRTTTAGVPDDGPGAVIASALVNATDLNVVTETDVVLVPTLSTYSLVHADRAVALSKVQVDVVSDQKPFWPSVQVFAAVAPTRQGSVPLA